MKKYLLLLMLPLFCGTGYAMGKKAPVGVSLLLVPARPAMIQLGMDMAAQEHALLMSYAPDTAPDKLFLHIWDGTKWMGVPQASYQNGSFIKNPASRMLVVGEENHLTATLIETALEWSPEVLHLGTDNTTELINQMGRLYEFKRADWEWIAQRYDLQLDNVNQGRAEQTSWYDANKASDLKPSEKPWKKPASSEPSQTPETSLSPVMPPVSTTPSPAQIETMSVEEEVEVAETKVKEEIVVVEDVPVEKEMEVKASSPVVTEEEPVDFSLEME